MIAAQQKLACRRAARQTCQLLHCTRNPQVLPTPEHRLKPKQRHSCAPSRSSSEMTAGSRGFSLLSTELVGLQGAYEILEDLGQSFLQEEKN